MSPLRHSNTATPSSSAPGAWSPLAMDVLRNMLDAADSSTDGSYAVPTFTSSPFPLAMASLEAPWDVSVFGTPSDTSLETFWEYPPSLTRSASPASSDSNSFVDDYTFLLNEPVVAAPKQRNSLSDMDESTAAAFLFHITQQVVKSADAPVSPASSNEDADVDAELQYHLRTLKPSHALAHAPEPLYDEVPIGTDAVPPRPPNAFILYRRHQQAHLRSERPGIHLHLASKLIAAWWRNEDAATKQYYRNLATDGRKELLKRFPDYKYRARTETEKALAKKNKKKDRKVSTDVSISPEHALYLQALSPYLCQ